MDAATQLALMSKAKTVFGTDQTFLSFPVTLLPFSQQQLNFTAEFNVANLQTFSLLVNQIPAGEAWLPFHDRYLWDAYNDMFQQGDFALSVRTAAEEAEYQAARSVSRQRRPDGTEEDTAMYKTYKQYADACYLAQQSYLALKGTAEASSDPAVKAQWATVDNPRLLQEIENCKRLWVIEGYKNEIEAAQNTVLALSAKSPAATRQEWYSRFDPTTNSLTDPASNQSFYPSSFSPSNALEEGSWQPFQLTADEVKALVAQAPAELKNRLSIGDGSSEIVSLSFEFSSAKVMRPWLATDAFKSRFWRFNPDVQPLSNGATPPAGSCPAYVTALVFARNLTITRQATPPAAPPGTSSPPPPPPETEPLGDFQFPTAGELVRPRRPQPPVPTKINPKLNDLSRIAERMEPIQGGPKINKGGLNRTVLNLSANSLMANSAGFQTQRLDSAIARQLAVDPQVLAAAPVASTALRQKAFRDIAGVNFSRLDSVLHPATDPSQPAAPPAPKTETDPSIYIFAFICKQLPLCPNPDLGLQW